MRGAMTVRLAAAARAAPRVCRAASGAARGVLPSATIRVSPELIRATARLAQIDVRDDEVDALVRIYITITRRAPSTRATDGGGRAPPAPRARDVYECVARRLTRAPRSCGVVPRALSLSLPAFPEQIPEFEEFLRFADSMYSADDAARDFEPTPQPTMIRQCAAALPTARTHANKSCGYITLPVVRVCVCPSCESVCLRVYL